MKQIFNMNVDGRTDFMTPETAVAMMIASENNPLHPDELIYTDSDAGYTPPVTPAAGETFDTVTEVYGNVRNVFGIGVTGKGTSGETFTRIIYPDGNYITLTGW